MDEHAVDVDVLVVGAGITGIYQLYRALEAGFTARLVEAGDGVGGTWFWNRYPGCRFDSESYTYAYLFSQELFDEWVWEEHFAGQPEVERYLNHVVDRFDLRRHVSFGTRVTSATWDDAGACWAVALDGGAPSENVPRNAPGGGAASGGSPLNADGLVRARYLVSATGVLSVPFYPDVPGRESIAGVSVHTGRWPTEPVDLAGKRVAVIGTGSSGVQIIPNIVDDVASLTVYQRTANWCTPLNNRPITDAEQAELRAGFERMKEILDTSVAGFLHEPSGKVTFDDTAEERQAFYEQMWNSPGFSKLSSNYIDLLMDPAANREWCDFIAAKVRSIVHDPAVADQLIPSDHVFGEKRPPFVERYYCLLYTSPSPRDS